ncbi:MAG: C39 family peptidase, partial [Chloroflexota bacterium]|nr:C39 family peptidase [Chloroflexota bacterium]
MHWLNVPHLQQSNPGWCLPTCVSMVSAYLAQPLLQDDVARWIGTRGIGTPSSQIQRLSRHGFEVFYGVGSLTTIEDWLVQQLSCILFVRTGDLRPYWKIDTPHAVVVGGFATDNVALFDPGLGTA